MFEINIKCRHFSFVLFQTVSHICCLDNLEKQNMCSLLLCQLPHIDSHYYAKTIVMISKGFLPDMIGMNLLFTTIPTGKNDIKTYDDNKFK